MKKKSLIGIAAAVVIGLALLVVLGAFFLFVSRFGRFGGYYGMMGPGYGFAHPFGWFGMLFWMIIPIGLLILLVMTGAWAVGRLVSSNRSVSSTVNPPTNQPLQTPLTHSCPSCGKPVQEDWKNCPYCGSNLS